jgi:DNA polymerase III subunit chi
MQPASMRIDFYILTDAAPNARERLSCRLAEKAWKLGHRVYLHAGSEKQAAELDELLWTFRDGSFVPHARAGERTVPAPPVVIGSSDEPAPGDADVLINLDSDVPGFYPRFTRIVEIVEPQEAARAAGRARFRFYREQGFDPHSHNV